jgi:hypothetical protein
MAVAGGMHNRPGGAGCVADPAISVTASAAAAGQTSRVDAWWRGANLGECWLTCYEVRQRS